MTDSPVVQFEESTKAGQLQKVSFVVLSLFLSGVTAADTQGKVLPDPAVSCEVFKPHNLCFETPKDGVARGEYFSEPFYAVILRTAERCSIPEEERLQTQALFPRSKVFSMRFECTDVEEFITYTNVNDKFAFLAVYAGVTLNEASKRLAEVKATGRFPGANIRKMQAVLVFP
jgi:hypothetical protein